MSEALQAPEAERTLLGAVLANPDLLAQVESLIQPRHMYEERNCRVFAAMLSLGDRGVEPDLVTVKDELVRHGQLEAIGGAPYIASLIDGMPRVSSIEHWAMLVREKARRRAALDLARRFAQKAEESGDGTDELIDSLRAGLERLTDAGDRGLQPIRDVVPVAMKELEEFATSPRGLVGVTTGLGDVDRMTGGLKAGALWIVAAFTSRGKSALCTQIATSAASEGKRVLMFSMEMPPPDVCQRMILGGAGLDRWALRAQRPADSAALNRVCGKLIELPITFDPREQPTAAEVRSTTLRHKAVSGCDLVIVDHLQRMARDPKAQGDDWLSVGQNAIALKSLARRLNLPVVAACQLSAEAEDKRPAMAHLARARGIISQEADVIAFLHPRDMREWDDRSVPRPSVTLIVDKQRGGPTGDLPLIFDRALTRFFGVDSNA